MCSRSSSSISSIFVRTSRLSAGRYAVMFDSHVWCSRHPGVRLPRYLDPFEGITRAILGQQVSLSAARTMVNRLVERYGERIDRDWRAFPTPKAVQDAGMRGVRIDRLDARQGSQRDLGCGGEPRWTIELVASRRGGARPGPGDPGDARWCGPVDRCVRPHEGIGRSRCVSVFGPRGHESGRDVVAPEVSGSSAAGSSQSGALEAMASVCRAASLDVAPSDAPPLARRAAGGKLMELAT